MLNDLGVGGGCVCVWRGVFNQTQVSACSSSFPTVPNINFLWLWPLKNGMCPETF